MINIPVDLGGGKLLPPQLSPRSLGLRSSLVTFHTMKAFVVVVSHSNQSGGHPSVVQILDR